jgi:hypothetical protein
VLCLFSIAGSWGLLAGLISIGSLHLHLLFKFGRLHTFHTEKTLTLLVFLGLALTTAAGVGNFFCTDFLIQSKEVSLELEIAPLTKTVFSLFHDSALISNSEGNAESHRMRRGYHQQRPSKFLHHHCARFCH